MSLDALLGRRALLGMIGAGIASTTAMPLLAQESTDAPTADEPAPETHDVIEMVMGDADAPIEMIEYASFTCPHCMRFHTEIMPQIKANYIDTGKVRLVYRPVYFDGPGLWADMMARCGGPMRYFGIVSLLYERQADWSRLQSGAEIAQALINLGKLAGLEEDTISDCMRDQDFARALVASYQENATRDNVQGTPSFIINGTPQSNAAYEAFATLFDGLLAE